MTGSARRLPEHRAHVRLSPRTRAAIAVRDLERGRPKRLPSSGSRSCCSCAPSSGVVSMGGVAAMVGANVVGSLAGGLPDPAVADEPRLRPADSDLRPDRQGGAGPVRAREPARGDVRRGSEARARHHDGGGGPDVLAERRLRPRRDRRRGLPERDRHDGQIERGASTITQQLVRARLLPPRSSQSNDRYLRKVMELLQASRLTVRLPGRDRQGADHHRLPQPDLLRPPGLRHRRGGHRSTSASATSAS